MFAINQYWNRLKAKSKHDISNKHLCIEIVHMPYLVVLCWSVILKMLPKLRAGFASLFIQCVHCWSTRQFNNHVGCGLFERKGLRDGGTKRVSCISFKFESTSSTHNKGGEENEINMYWPIISTQQSMK